MEELIELKTILKDRFADKLQDEIRTDRTLGQLGLDSLDCLEFADYVELRFGMNFNGSNYPVTTTRIDEIIQFIKGK